MSESASSAPPSSSSKGVDGHVDAPSMPFPDFKKRWRSLASDADRASRPADSIQFVNDRVIEIIRLKGSSFSSEELSFLLNHGVPDVVRNLTRRKMSDEVSFSKASNLFENVLVLISWSMRTLNRDSIGLQQTLGRIFDESRPFYRSYNVFSNEAIAYRNYIDSQKLTAESDSVLLPNIALESLMLEDKDGEDDAPREYAIFNVHSTRSRFFYHFVNVFGRVGGFQAILRRICNPVPPPSMGLLKQMVNNFVKAKTVLSLRVKRHFCSILRDNVFQFMSGLEGDAFRKVEKKDVEELVRDMEIIIKVVEPEDVYSICERFCLDFALKCFLSENLKKRLHGLWYMEESINMTKRRRHYNWPGSMAHHSSWNMRFPAVAKWMTTDFLLGWFREHKVIETVFTQKKSNIHEEVIKKSRPIMKFFAESGKLTKEDLDMVWGATEMHDAMVDAVLEMLGSIARWIPFELQYYLLKHVYDIPMSEYRPRTLGLIWEFATYSNTDVEIKLKTMNLLWQIVRDDMKVSQDISDLALNNLLKLVHQHAFRPHRSHVIGAFLRNVKERRSVVQCIRLLHKALESYIDGRIDSRAREPMDTRQGVIQHWNDMEDLLSSLLEELTQYKRTVTRASSSGDAFGKHMNSTVFEGRYTHLENVEVRLKLLSFILENSSLTLSNDMVDPLWDALMTHACSEEERKACLNWFHNLINNFERVQSYSEIVQHVFDTKLSPVVLRSDISSDAYTCFRTYFYAYNRQKKVLDIDQPGDKFSVLRHDQLDGLDTLWELILGCESSAVFQRAMMLLINLHQQVVNTAELNINDIRQTFIDRCMAYLKESIADSLECATHAQEVAASTGTAARIDRLVTLLQTFLDESAKRDKLGHSKASGGNSSSRGASGGAHGASKRQHGNGKKSPPKPTTESHRTQTAFIADMFALNEVAAYIAFRKNHYDSNQTALWLTDDAKKNSAIEEAASYGVAASGESKGDDGVVEIHVESTSVSVFLSNNQAYFDLLFELLVVPMIDQARVWRILKLLPVNDRIQRSLQLLDDAAPCWPELLPAHSPYKFLYCLQIIQDLYTAKPRSGQSDDAVVMGPAPAGASGPAPRAPAPPTDQELAAKSKWCRDFFHSGGFHHLFAVFVEERLGGRSPAVKASLALLVHVLLHFMSGAVGALAAFPAQSRSGGDRRDGDGDGDGGGGGLGYAQLTLSRGTRKKLVDSVNFEKLMLLSMKLTWDVASGRVFDRSEEDATTVQGSLRLLGVALAARSDLVPSFCEYTHPGGHGGMERFLHDALVECPDEGVRIEVQQGLLGLVHHSGQGKETGSPITCVEGAREAPSSAISAFLLDQLLLHVPPKGSVNGQVEQLFVLLNRLLDMHLQQKGALPHGHQELQQTLLDRIMSRRLVERTREGEVDHVLAGMMLLATTMLRYRPEDKPMVGKDPDLVAHLYHRALFPGARDFIIENGSVYVETNLCKTPFCREQAFALLLELCTYPPHLQRVLDWVQPNHAQDPPGIGWDIPPDPNVTGYVGLRNPGCICYMNALMQQLYMTPALRAGLLVAPNGDGGGGGGHDDGKSDGDGDDGGGASTPSVGDASCGGAPASPEVPLYLRDDLLLQIQLMFAHLQHGQNKFYDPEVGFCKAFKDRSGRPVDVTVQQDAEEFLCLLSERLETLLEGTPQQGLLDHFTARQSQLLRCSVNQEHFSERADPLPVLSIEIAGKANLQAALQYYVQGDLVEWRCADCGDVMVENALKRGTLKTLANTLIIHLKRFHFNYDTMMREKLSSRFEFPLELDMEPYTTEGVARRELVAQYVAEREAAGEAVPEDVEAHVVLPPLRHKGYYAYQLVGVLIHTGTAEAGHYYSFIKDRAKDARTGRWYRFDDTTVSSWDISNLEREAFGGDEQVAYDAWSSSKRPKAYNAYMLFYQRVELEPEDSRAAATATATEHNADGNVPSGSITPVSLTPTRPPGRPDDASPMQNGTPIKMERLGGDVGGDGGRHGVVGVDAVGGGASTQCDPPLSSGESLVGERPTPIATGDATTTTTLSSEVPSAHHEEKEGRCSTPRSLEEEFASLVPDPIRRVVWEENHKSLRNRYLFEPAYFSFVADLFLVASDARVGAAAAGAGGGASPPQEGDEAYRLIEFGVRLTMDYFIRARDEETYRRFCDVLYRMLRAHPPASRWLLQELMDGHSKWYKYMLLDCPDAWVRYGFVRVVEACLRAVGPTEYDQMDLETPERRIALPYGAGSDIPRTKEPEYTHRSKALSVQFIEHMIGHMDSTRVAWRRFHQYWYLLRRYAAIGHRERLFLVDRGVCGLLIHYYMGIYSPYRKPSDSVAKLGDGIVSADLVAFMDLLADVVLAAHTDASDRLIGGRREEDGKGGDVDGGDVAALPSGSRRDRPPTSADGPLGHLDLKSRRLLFNREFFQSLLKQAYNSNVNNMLVSHLAWEDEEKSLWLLGITHSNIARLHGHQRHMADIIKVICNVRDSLQPWRVRVALNTSGGGLLHVWSEARMPSTDFLFHVLHILTELIDTNPIAAGFLYSIRSKWRGLEQSIVDKLDNDGIWSGRGALPLWKTRDALREILDRLRQFWDCQDPTELPHPIRWESKWDEESRWVIKITQAY